MLAAMHPEAMATETNGMIMRSRRGEAPSERVVQDGLLDAIEKRLTKLG